jgi:hypothetical protein
MLSDRPESAHRAFLGSKPIKSCAAASASDPLSDIADVERFVREGPEADI